MNRVSCQDSVYFKTGNFMMFFQNETNAGDYTTNAGVSIGIQQT